RATRNPILRAECRIMATVGRKVGILRHRLSSQRNGISDAAPSRSHPGNTVKPQRPLPLDRKGVPSEHTNVFPTALVRLAGSTSFASASFAGCFSSTLARTAGCEPIVLHVGCCCSGYSDVFCSLERTKVLLRVYPTIVHLGS